MTKQPCIRHLFALLFLLAAGVAAHPANAQIVTDITLVRTDNSGNTVQEGFNTQGAPGDSSTVSNLYLLSGGTFVNSGNTNSATIALNLSAPGTYTFAFVGENVNNNTGAPLAINFFFDNNAVTPRISGRGSGAGDLVPNSGTTDTPTFVPVPGANSLTYLDNGLQITLTNFTYQTTGGPEQVQSFDNTPNGLSDTNGSFTLTVSAVTAPEPGSLGLLFAGGLLSAAGASLRRRRRCR